MTTTAERVAERLIGMVPSGVEAEASVKSGTLSLTRFANSFIHQNVSEEGARVRLRVALDGKVASGSTTRSDQASLRQLINQTIEVAKLQQVDEEWPGLTQTEDIPPGDHFDEATAAAEPGARAELVRTFVDSNDGLASAGYCSTEGWNVAYANTNGHRAAADTSRAAFDGIQQTEDSAGSAHAASIAISDLDGTALGSQAAQRAISSANPSPVEPGEYEVVLAPEAVGTLVVFLAFLAFNGKFATEDRSMAEMGEQQFDRSLTLTEDPSDRRAVSLPFDGEGSPRRTVQLISKGISSGFTYDRRAARKAGAESTGNRAAGPLAFYGPVAKNLFLAPGPKAVDSMIGEVEHGLFVSTFNYCRPLDEKAIVVTGLTRNGTFLIENGSLAGAVENLRFTQSFPAALASGNVLGVGDDARFADSEAGPGVTFVPSLRLASWNFTGGAAG